MYGTNKVFDYLFFKMLSMDCKIVFSCEKPFFYYFFNCTSDFTFFTLKYCCLIWWLNFISSRFISLLNKSVLSYKLCLKSQRIFPRIIKYMVINVHCVELHAVLSPFNCNWINHFLPRFNKFFHFIFLKWSIWCNIGLILKEGWKINNSKSNSSQPNDSLEIYAAKLAYVGLVITTLGNGIETIAAGLALEALRKSNTSNSQNDMKQSMKKDNMQKQINYLIYELKQVKKIIN